MDHDLEIICVEPPHGLTIYQVSTQSDVNCRRSYTETKKFTDGRTDGRTDAEGYNIIRPFFKRAYKNWLNDATSVGFAINCINDNPICFKFDPSLLKTNSEDSYGDFDKTCKRERLGNDAEFLLTSAFVY